MTRARLIARDAVNVARCVARGWRATRGIGNPRRRLLAGLAWYADIHPATRGCTNCARIRARTSRLGATVGIWMMLVGLIHRWMLNAYWGDL